MALANGALAGQVKTAVCQTSKNFKIRESRLCSSSLVNQIKSTTSKPKDTRVSSNQDHLWRHQAITTITRSPRERRWVSSPSKYTQLEQIAVNALLLKSTRLRVAKRALIFLVDTMQASTTSAHPDLDLSPVMCSTRLGHSIRLHKTQDQLTTLDQSLWTNRTKPYNGSSSRTKEARSKSKITKSSLRQPSFGLPKLTNQTDLTGAATANQVLSAWQAKILSARDMCLRSTPTITKTLAVSERASKTTVTSKYQLCQHDTSNSNPIWTSAASSRPSPPAAVVKSCWTEHETTSFLNFLCN